jgi:phage gpG-like protein
MARNKGFRFKKAVQAAGGVTQKLALPIGNIAQKHFERNFDKQGFVDNSLSRWKEVQRRTPGTQAWKRSTPAARTNPILRGKGSGVLAKSIKVVKADRRMIRLSTIGKANTYANYHNEETGKIPQRKFMGDSKQLNKKIITRIGKEVDRVLRMV